MDLKIYLNHLGMLCASESKREQARASESKREQARASESKREQARASESKREQARAGGIFVGVFSSKASNYFSDKGRDLEKVVRGDWFERRYREN